MNIVTLLQGVRCNNEHQAEESVLEKWISRTSNIKSNTGGVRKVYSKAVNVTVVR